jgi:hypothetical protein
MSTEIRASCCYQNRIPSTAYGQPSALRAEWTKLRTLSGTWRQCPSGKSGRNA